MVCDLREFAKFMIPLYDVINTKIIAFKISKFSIFMDSPTKAPLHKVINIQIISKYYCATIITSKQGLFIVTYRKSLKWDLTFMIGICNNL